MLGWSCDSNCMIPIVHPISHLEVFVAGLDIIERKLNWDSVQGMGKTYESFLSWWLQKGYHRPGPRYLFNILNTVFPFVNLHSLNYCLCLKKVQVTACLWAPHLNYMWKWLASSRRPTVYTQSICPLKDVKVFYKHSMKISLCGRLKYLLMLGYIKNHIGY